MEISSPISECWVLSSRIVLTVSSRSFSSLESFWARSLSSQKFGSSIRRRNSSMRCSLSFIPRLASSSARGPARFPNSVFIPSNSTIINSFVRSSFCISCLSRTDTDHWDKPCPTPALRSSSDRSHPCLFP